MKEITPTTQLTTPPAILIEGAPGTAKTTLALQFPSVYHADLDLNSDGPIRYLRSVNKLRPYHTDTIALADDHTPESPKVIKEEERYDRLITSLKSAVSDPRIKWIIVDGMTQLDTFIHAKVHKATGKSVGTPLAIQDWRPFREYLMQVIQILRYSGKPTITICHLESVMSEQVKGQMASVIGYKPLVSTKIGEVFAGFFTDVWLMTASPAPQGKTLFKLHTQKQHLYGDLKNAYLMPAVIENPTYEEISKYIK